MRDEDAISFVPFKILHVDLAGTTAYHLNRDFHEAVRVSVDSLLEST